MKKSILVFAGVAVLAAFFSQLSAQQPAGAPATDQGTKVAVINVGYVFQNFERAKAAKAEIEEILRKPKQDAQKLYDDMKAWEREAKDPKNTPQKREEYEVAIRNGKRTLEDMQLQVQKLVGKKQEDNLVTLWKDVNMGIEKVAQAYGFQIVLGYGEPMEKELLALFPNINRKMQALDQGSTVPLYVHGSVDLSHAVTVTLNNWHKSTGGAIQPTSGTYPPKK